MLALLPLWRCAHAGKAVSPRGSPGLPAIASLSMAGSERRKFRRVKTLIQVNYDTPVERLESFVEGIKKIIEEHPNTRKDFFHIVFNDFGEHSLNVLLYFFLKVPDWSTELLQRQKIFLDIMKLAESMDVKFAFPTRTLHVKSIPNELHQ